MNEQERIAELERRIMELEQKLNQSPMARVFESLKTPEASMHLRSVGRQQLLLMAEVARGLAELIAPPEPGDVRDERQTRNVPVD